jgi:hypothetical protein
MSIFEEEEELQAMRPRQTMYGLPIEELTIRKALYYDFMLYRRILKPFNSFLVKNGLQNRMYQQVARPPVIATMASSGTTMWTVKNEELLHESLQQFLAQEAQKPGALDNIDTHVYNLENLFKQNGINNNLFTPKTSEQIDANIRMLVSNIAAGRTYDCSTDAIMSAIMNGRFDEYLSEQNKEQMMQICGPAAEATEAAAAAEEQKGFSFKSLFGLGGRKMKRSKKRNIKRSKKRYIKRSKKRSNRRSIKRSKSNKKYRGGYEGMFNVPPPSYLGSIQGKYMNLDGKQLMTNPTDGIA